MWSWYLRVWHCVYNLWRVPGFNDTALSYILRTGSYTGYFDNKYAFIMQLQLFFFRGSDLTQLDRRIYLNANLFPHGSKFTGSAHSNITIRETQSQRFCFSDQINIVRVWPEKQTTKRKQKQSIEHTLSVITSDT